MSTIDLAVLVELKDKLSSEFQKMAKNVNFDKMVASSKKFAAGMAVVAGAVAAGGAASVNAAREQIKVEKQLDAVLKSTQGAVGLTADEIKKMASELQSVTNYGDEAIISGQNMLLTFTKIGADVFPAATQTMLDMSAAMGQDLQSTAIQLGKALNDPIAGISALSRVGVQLSEEQKGLINSFMEVGEVAKAQQVILDELAVQFGGSAEAVADPMIQLKNAVGDIAEEIGKALIPYIEIVANKFLEWMDSMGGAAGVVDYLKDAFNRIKPVLPIIAGAIGGALVGALIAATVAMWGFISPLLIPIAIGAAIAAAIVGVVMAIRKIGEVAPGVAIALGAAWDWIKEKTIFMWNGIVAAIQVILTVMKAIVGVYIKAVKFIFVDTLGSMKDAVMVILNVFKVLWDVFWGSLKAGFDLMLAGIKAAWDLHWNLITAAFKLYLNVITAAVNAFKEWFAPIWDAIFSGVHNSIETLQAAWSNTWAAIQETVSSTVETILEILGPFISGIEKAISVVKSFASGAVSAAKGAVGLGGGGTNGGKAKGGSVGPGQTFNVGEAGPEIFRPAVRGMIIPNSKAAGRGQTIQINISGNTLLDRQAAEKMGDLIIKKLRLQTRLA